MKNLELVKVKQAGLVEEQPEYHIDIMKDGVKVGYAYTIEDPDNNSTYLEDITIYEEYRNQGIGTAVLKQLAKESENYQIHMAPTDEDNQRLYERLGEETNITPEVDQGYGVYKIYG